VGAQEMHSYDLGRTAEALGIHRKMLQRMLRSYGLSRVLPPTHRASISTTCQGQTNPVAESSHGEPLASLVQRNPSLMTRWSHSHSLLLLCAGLHGGKVLVRWFLLQARARVSSARRDPGRSDTGHLRMH
jgi:hypothetical protein